MKYTDIKDFTPALFKRLTGTKRTTFEAMIKVVEDYKLLHRKSKNGGRPPKLLVPDQLLMMLMYYREYRTFLHIGVCYDMSEMNCWRIVTGIEKILIESKIFHLPGKKALYSTENEFEVIIIDVSEHPIERPKKNSEKIIPAKRNDIQ
jgi:Helix-turn-helix of DDE superfamily endonuclease